MVCKQNVLIHKINLLNKISDTVLNPLFLNKYTYMGIDY